MKISPSLLGCNFLRLEEEIGKLEKNKADYIHIDLMDGHFVPNICLGFEIIRDIKKVTNIPLDVHLMLENPHEHIEKIAELMGNDKESILTIHVESNSIIGKAIYGIKSLGMKAGIALNPHTPIEKIKPYINDVDLVLQMTVQPGYGGQKIIPEAMEKCSEIRNMLPPDVLLETDGGITGDNAHLLKEAGVDIIVIGNYFWKSNSEEIKALKEL